MISRTKLKMKILCLGILVGRTLMGHSKPMPTATPTPVTPTRDPILIEVPVDIVAERVPSHAREIAAVLKTGADNRDQGFNLVSAQF